MNVKDCIKDYLMNTDKHELLDVSLAYFYKAVKDQECGKELARRADACCKEQGAFEESSLHLGKVLYERYLETKDEKYRNTMEQLHAECKDLWQENKCLNEDWADILYMTGPFTMAYDTAFQNKEHYNEIIETFENTYSRLRLGEEISLPFAARYAMALIDTMGVMSKEIFEHYKTLERLFKNTIQGILQIIKNENNSYQAIDKSDIERFALSDLARVCYVILKACRMKVLLSEKYQATGMDLFDYILGVVYDIQEDKLKVTDQDEVMAVFIMAYAERLMLNSEI